MAGRVVSSQPGGSVQPGGSDGVTESVTTETAVPRARSVRSSSSDSASRRTGRRIGSSTPGGFVDARSMNSDASVSERLDSPDFGGPGLFARPKVVHFPERVKERRMAHVRMIAVRAGVAAAIIAVVALVVWALLFSPLLRLLPERITVGGTNTWVSGEQVARIASEQTGKSLLLVDTADIESRIGALPGVTSAEAVKHYPHGLEVTVQAEIPAAVLRDTDGTLTAVDREGRVLNAVNASVDGIPVIDVENTDDSLGSAAIGQALKVLGTLDESMRQRVTQVKAKTQDSITTVLDDEYTIIWGNSSQMKLKKAVVDTLLSMPDQLGDAKTIDVAAPDKATIK